MIPGCNVECNTMPRRANKALTVKAVENAKLPKSGSREIPDGVVGGLCLRVSATGTKSFILSSRVDGKLRRQVIGKFPAMKLAAARTKAAHLKDHPEEWNAAEQAEPAPETEPHGVITFTDIAERYIARECPRLKRGREVEQTIRRELLPHWGHRPMTELRKRGAVERTDALVDAGKPGAANRLHELIRRIGRWAARRDEIDFNPFADMDPPAPKVIRDRMLSPDDLRLVWLAWEQSGYPFGPAGKLLLVTAQRLSEVAQMQWSEIDRDAKVWIIPAKRTKSGREMVVPLSSLALEIIDGLPKFAGGDYVFTTRGGRRPISGFSKAKRRTDKLVKAIAKESNNERLAQFAEDGLKPWRLHDLRRTARTGLTDLGVPEVVAEKVLNHAERKVLAKTYNRHEYAVEKRDALDCWAQRLRAIIEPPRENVVLLDADGGTG